MSAELEPTVGLQRGQLVGIDLWEIVDAAAATRRGRRANTTARANLEMIDLLADARGQISSDGPRDPAAAEEETVCALS